MESVLSMNYYELQQEEMMYLDGGWDKMVRWVIEEAVSIVFGAAVGLAVTKVIQAKGVTGAISAAGSKFLTILKLGKVTSIINFAVGLAIVVASAVAIGYAIYLVFR